MGVVGRIIVSESYRNCLQRYKLLSFGSGYGQLDGSYQCSNEYQNFMKVGGQGSFLSSRVSVSFFKRNVYSIELVQKEFSCTSMSTLPEVTVSKLWDQFQLNSVKTQTQYWQDLPILFLILFLKTVFLNCLR
jgi:hypothetical protein